MASDAAFISRKIHELLGAAVKVFGPLSPPIDPFALADLCGVSKITRQLMVPEGVLQVVEEGFEIFLQDNFADQPGSDARQRFTLAHELVHTFYYDRSVRPPRTLQGAPEGNKLELLCNSGAGQLLVPSLFLRKRAKEGIISQGPEIIDLAREYSVSHEVLIRRLHDDPTILESNFAVLLVDYSDASKATIQAACNTDWLRAEFSLPRPGTDFLQWIKPVWDSSSGEVPPDWTSRTGIGVIHVKTITRYGRRRLLEMKLGPS